MKRPLVPPLALLALLACSKTERGREHDVERCSAINTQAELVALCLISDYGWNEVDANAAGRARQRELDSTRLVQVDSIWNVNAAKHREEIRSCSATPDRDMVQCLLLFGWPEERAVAAEEFTWLADAPRHDREVRDCVRRQRGANIASCLMLYYKWPDRRALAANDSVARHR